MRELNTIEQVAKMLKDDWCKHGSKHKCYLLENSLSRFKAQEAAELAANLERVIGCDEFGMET